MRARKELNWTVGHCDDASAEPLARVPAIVPGAVQLDWARAENYGEVAFADNYKDYLWMEDRYWSYQTILDLPELQNGERLFFVSKGIDYQFMIRIDGSDVFAQEGMFTPVEIDLTPYAGTEIQMEIRVFPAPKHEGAPVGRRQADQCCKPAVSYGWDWHPRLIPLGIWDDTYLELRPACYIASSEVFYELNAELTKAVVRAQIQLSKPLEGKIEWTISNRHGGRMTFVVTEDETDQFTLLTEVVDPELWWPNGQGEAALYSSEISLFDASGNLLDETRSRIGFRTVRLVMHPDAWKEPSAFPKSRSTPPITLEINGRRIFAKGSNWVNPDIFPGRLTGETYKQLIDLAVDANFNLFRVWGGGIVNKASFFEQCDESGIMVWQEFPLACNNYEGTEAYLAVLDQESRSIITRYRSHASIVLWCGGNELFNSWSGMTDQSLALRLLNKNCYELDKNRPYLMTSPVMGMGHGHYVFRDMLTGEEVYQWMVKASNTAYTEFGVPSPSSVEVLREIIPAEEMFPPKPGTSWETHHAYGAWVGETWLCENVIEHYFGYSDSLEQLVERGQLLQSEGYKCIYEEGRRQKPVCSMTLNWCYNEPWQTAANNSLINWPARPKPAYYAVAASCRPVLASARLSKYLWEEGQIFDPELWLLNDSPEEVAQGSIEAFLVMDEQEIPLLVWNYPRLPADTNQSGPIIRYPLPRFAGDRFQLILRVPGRPELDSSYTLAYRSKGTVLKAKADVMNV